jgi:hypothetical protein
MVKAPPLFHPHGRVWLGSQIVKPLQHVAQMEESLAAASSRLSKSNHPNMGGSHSAGLQQLGQVSMAQASVRAHTCFCVRGQARVAIWVLLPVKGCARFRWSVAKALMIQARIIHANLFGIFS